MSTSIVSPSITRLTVAGTSPGGADDSPEGEASVADGGDESPGAGAGAPTFSAHPVITSAATAASSQELRPLVG
jgi:hypothetical protein